MNENISKASMPMLLPYEPVEFWQQLRSVIKEELTTLEKPAPANLAFETPGMTYKPLLKITEVCQLFQVSKPTIYEWIKLGKLRRVKVRSRVYFLWGDIEALMTPDNKSK